MESSPSQRKGNLQVGVLAAGHAVTDAYAAFPSPLWPMLVAKLGLTMSMVSLATSVMSISASFMQPLYGYWADRTRKRIFVVAGPAITAVFMCLIGQATSYMGLLCLMVLSGIGVAAFHPQAAASVGTGGYRRKGLALSVFITGGALGYAAGPLVASSFASSFGVERLYLLIAPGVLTSLLLHLFVAPPSRKLGEVGLRGLLKDLRPNLAPLCTLYVVSALRASATIGIVTFLPFLLKGWGVSVVGGGTLVSLFLLAGSIGGMVGGTLSDRVDRRKLLSGSLAFTAPLLLLMATRGQPGPAFVCSMMFGSFALAFPNPVNVVLAQELVPNNVNTASALMMGSSWGTGGMIAAGFGLVADAYGVPVLLTGIALVPGCAALVSLILFRRPLPCHAEARTVKRA